MKQVDKLTDCGSERALIATIIKGGKDSLIDCSDIVQPTDFSLPINKTIYLCLQQLAEDPHCESFDIESIKLKAKTLGLAEHLSSKKDIEYLEFLKANSFDKKNIQLFALQIKKLSIARDLYSRYTDALNYLGNISGQETLSDIIKECESRIIDFVNGVDQGKGLELLSENIEQYVDEILAREVIDQPGLPTNFVIWDEAIGGGLRRGTVNVIGSRSKVGKSWMALNMGINVAKRKIPVLLLDSELTKNYQKSRMVCIHSQCPIGDFETGKFKYNKELTKRVIDSSRQLENLPLYYESIGGMSPSEILSVARRWIVKHVGFNDQGKANDCLIVYDYLKLTSGDNLSKHTPEYILLGLIITEMHNFALKYDVPFLSFVQLNRDGIDQEDTSIVAGSDRILWLCSSLSIFKNKSEDDVAMGCGWEHGNKAMKVLDCRHGPGLEDGNYINLKCSLRPNIGKEACGLIREGMLFSQVRTAPIMTNDNKPRDNSGDQRKGK